jgi:hypothetical protein
MSELSPSQQAYLEEQIARHGLEAVAGDIRSLARESIHLATAGPDDYSRTGNTRLGGVPDLPEGMAWPTVGQRKGSRHLAFLAQINLGELPRTVDDLLPHEGMLYFFSDSVGDADFVRVFFHRGGGPLVRADAPARLCPFFKEGDSNLKPHQAKSRLVVSTPNRASYDPEAKPMWQSLRTLKLNDAYYALQNSLLGPKHGGPGQGHLMLGYGTGVVRSAEKADRVLLFEMDSDRAVGTCWSDMGLVHVLIGRDDLAARRFDRVSPGIFSG